MKVELLKVPVKLVLEYAFAAHRINNGYVKENTYRDSNTVFSNKELVKLTLQSLYQKTWLPENFIPLEITESDRKAANQVDSHFKKYMIKSLAGSLNPFEQDVYTAICSDEITINKVGTIAYIPELINRDQNKWTYEKFLKSEYKNSQHVEDPSVSGEMTIVNVRDVKTSSREVFRIVVAGMNGNLYQFYNSKIDLDSEGQQYNIKGKNKGLGYEYTTKIPLTKLNYVKLSKCQNHSN
jgi:hypothetical protein